MAWLLGRRRLYTVVGTSMLPTLAPGERVWARVRPLARVQPGAIVVVRSPTPPPAILVKRLASRMDDSFTVKSDSPDGAFDSLRFGSLASSALLGEVTLILDVEGRLRRP